MHEKPDTYTLNQRQDGHTPGHSVRGHGSPKCPPLDSMTCRKVSGFFEKCPPCPPVSVRRVRIWLPPVALPRPPDFHQTNTPAGEYGEWVLLPVPPACGAFHCVQVGFDFLCDSLEGCRP